MTPDELMQAILKAPVDLLWNGGIGTYVKASRETNADVGDRSTTRSASTAPSCGCEVIGEGGNLGSPRRAGSSSRSPAAASTPTSSTTPAACIARTVR